MPLPLSKTSSEAPDWIANAIFPNLKNKEEVSSAVKVSGSDLTAAKTKIEESAKSGKQICIQGDISVEQKKELEEYAQVCNVDPKKIIQVSKREVAIASKKEAQVKPPPEKDPFGVINSFADPKSFEKSKKWNEVKAAQKVTSQGKSEGSVNIVDGVEKYESQTIVGVRPGENSIAAPNNIKETADSKEKSSAEIIRAANKERKDKISFDKKVWEENVKSKDSGIIIGKGVKLTEASPQQSHSRVGDSQHSIFDKKDKVSSIPEKTAGEILKESNQKRKESIQRPKSEDKSWDKVQSSVKPTVSDVLYEELKKRLPLKKNSSEKK